MPSPCPPTYVYYAQSVISPRKVGIEVTKNF